MFRLPLSGAACVTCGEPPIAVPEATVIVIVLVLATVLALTGLPSLSAFVLMAEAVSTGSRVARRLRAARPTVAKRV